MTGIRNIAFASCILVLTPLTGCPGDDHGDGGLWSGATSGAGGTSDVSVDSTAASAATGESGTIPGTGSEESGGSSQGILLDVGHDDGVPTCDPSREDCSCTAVDILFVIDNSGSMFVHQQRLAQVFPLFVDLMIEALPSGTDLHVGITTQGGFWGGDGSGSWSESCVTDANPYPAGYMPPTAGMHGTNGDQGRLYEHDGQRFFAIDTAADPQPLAQWFSAAATLPQADSPQEDQVELLSAAGAYPFHPVNAALNAGFLRDEGAVLLIFFLTDTADITPESASDLADIVREAKTGCGGDTCILTAGMVNQNHFCGAQYPRLDEFLNAFGKPPVATGSILGNGGAWPPQPAPVEEYEAVLGQALAEVLAQTCDEIGPPAG